jgi:anti-sigma B factor antagonist
VKAGVRTRPCGDWTVLEVSGELDLASAPGFRQAVVAAVADGSTRLIIDLTVADYIDSVGVGLFLGALKRVRTHDGDVAIVCDEPRLLRVLELTEVNRIIPVHARVVDIDGVAR